MTTATTSTARHNRDDNQHGRDLDDDRGRNEWRQTSTTTTAITTARRPRRQQWLPIDDSDDDRGIDGDCVLHSFPVVRLTSGSQPVFFHFIVLSPLHSNPLECPLIGERRQHPSPTPTFHSSLTQWQYSPPPLGPVAHISFPSPTSSGEGDLPASSTMPARQPRQRQPPKRFRAANSSSEDGDNEPPGSSIAPVSSRATSPSRTSSPMPLQQERPQVN
ncbi:hypothetical protein EDB84DRAFT_1444254 [Lactarius hengduanensis]|nr:hypothetical protein EDB84DRAFT_1444254 [Lactarius hengduanensis]